jgi:hypothetical protein
MFTSPVESNGCMAAADESPYGGGELDLFSLATNWKNYIRAEIGKYLSGDVLEVGAAIGAMIVGSVRALAEQPSFDCVLYIDVLEHIQDDRLQIEQAARLVRAFGRIVILSPAHQWLFSEFDKRIGHLRRYNKEQLRSLMPSGWSEEKLVYLDSIGVLLSLGNVLVLGQAMPSRLQISVWDRVCVPLSRIVDRALLGNFGKSILAVWYKNAAC